MNFTLIYSTHIISLRTVQTIGREVQHNTILQALYIHLILREYLTCLIRIARIAVYGVDMHSHRGTGRFQHNADILFFFLPEFYWFVADSCDVWCPMTQHLWVFLLKYYIFLQHFAYRQAVYLICLITVSTACAGTLKCQRFLQKIIDWKKIKKAVPSLRNCRSFREIEILFELPVFQILIESF